MNKVQCIVGATVLAVSSLAWAQAQGEPAEREATTTTANAPVANAPDTEAQRTLDLLLSSIETNDYAVFAGAVNDEMKVALTKPMFEQVSEQVAPRLKAGYKAVYLGELKKLGHRVHLWKIAFEDNGDDLLAELSVKDKTVGGFFLR